MANIPVNENDRLVIVTATTAGQTDFDFDFLASTVDQIAATHIAISDGTETELVHTADFTATGLGNANGGTITLTGTTIAQGDKIAIYGNTTIQRLSDFQQSGDFRAKTVNAEEDLQTMIKQEMQRDIDRALKTGFGDPAVGDLPLREVGKALVWSGTENKLINAPIGEASIRIDVETAEAARIGSEAARDEAQAYSQQTSLDIQVTETNVAATEAARDAAIAGASGLYADTTTGLSATSDGDLFLVQGSRETFATLYQNDGGTAVPQNLSLASSAALDILRHEAGLDLPQGYGPALVSDTPTNGAQGGGAVVLEASPANVPSVLHRAEFQADAPGTAFLFVLTVSGTTATVISKKSFELTSGFNTVFPDMDIPAGAFVGFNGRNVIGRYTGTNSTPRSFGGNPNVSVNDTFTLDGTTTSTIFGVNMYITAKDAILGRVISAENTVLKLDSSIVIEGGVTGSEGWVGRIENAAPTSVLGSAFNLIDPDIMVPNGKIKRLKVWMDTAATVFVRSYTKTGQGDLYAGDTVTVRNSQAVNCAPGYNDIAVDVDFISGDYVGIHAPGGNLRTLGSGNPHMTFYGGRLDSEMSFQITSQNNTQFLFQLETESVDTGLLVHVEQLLNDVDILKRSLSLDATGNGIGYRLPDLGAFSVKAHLYASVFGQSNALGTDPAITTVAEYGALGFSNNANTVLSLGADTVGGNESPGFGMAAYLREQLMFSGGPSQSDESKIIIGRAAQGGTTIAGLSKGTQVYANNQSQLSAAKTYAGSNEFRHLGQGWFHGEADANAGTTRTDYKTRFKALAVDFDADSRAAVTGDYKRPTFAMQMTSALDYAGTNGWEIALAQYESFAESDLISLVAPCYQLPFSDDRHVTSQGSRVAGALIARAMFSFAATGVLAEPLHVVEAKIVDNTIVLFYNKTGLMEDTTLIAGQKDCGFTINDGTTDVVIDSVTVIRNKVILECANAQPIAGWTWSYGNLMATELTPYAGGAGNLRDSAGDFDQIDGIPLHNWAVLQEGVL